MSNKIKNVKWTAKIKALIISLSLAFVVALGGAGAAIGLSLSDNNGKRLDSIATGEATADQSSAWNTAVNGSGTFTMVSNWDAEVDNDTFINKFGTGPNFKDGALYIPAGKTVTIDLKTFSLNRGQKVDVANGAVIINDGNLTIKGTTGSITGGWNTENGGGIINNGILKIEGGVIKGNRTVKNGGGIYSATDSTLTITGGTIGAANTATATNGNMATGTGSLGGGVYGLHGTFTISGGTFIGNSAVTGGGVNFNSNKKITISGGTFGGTNTDAAKNGNTVTGSGGGLYVLFAGAGSSMTGGTFTGNTAGAAGGICIAQSSLTASVSGITVKNNTAGSNGGGIRVFQTSATFSGNCVIEGNQAKYGGGISFEPNGSSQTLTISDTEIKNNVVYAANNAAVGGGGIYSVSGNLNLNAGTKITGNHQETPSTYYGAGGGVYTTSVTTINGATIDGNYTRGNGGGILSTNKLTMQGNTTISNNWISVDTTSGYGAGMYCAGTATISGGKFEKNGFTNFTKNSNTNQGGAICNSSTMTITKCTIVSNRTTNRGGAILQLGGSLTIGTSGGNNDDVVFRDNYCPGNGGAIYRWEGKITVHSGTFESNSAGSGGGAICTNRGNTLDINGGVFKNNGYAMASGAYAVTGTTSSGGAIASLNYTGLMTTININGGTFTGNKATNYGGAIYLPVVTNINGGTFKENQAPVGSFMFIATGLGNTVVTMSGGTAENNTAAGDSTNKRAGAVFTSDNTIFNLYGGSIINNTTSLTSLTAEQGAGVKINGTLNIAGNPKVTGNKIGTGTSAVNANLFSAKVVNVTASLVGGTSIYTSNTGVVTSGYTNKGNPGSSMYFSADSTSYKTALLNGEVVVVTSSTNTSNMLASPTANSATLSYNGSAQTIISGYDSSTMTIKSVVFTRYQLTSNSAFETSNTTASYTANASAKTITATNAGKYVITIGAAGGKSWVNTDGTSTTTDRELTVIINKRDLKIVDEYNSTSTYNGSAYLTWLESREPTIAGSAYAGVITGWTKTYYIGTMDTNGQITNPSTHATYGKQAGVNYYCLHTPVFVNTAVQYNNHIPAFYNRLNLRKNIPTALTFTVTNADNIVYTGSALKPNFTISYKNTTLYTYTGSNGAIATNDSTTYGSLTFTAAYTNNTRPGTATITITFTAGTNFDAGTVTKTFTIKPMSMAAGTITGAPNVTLSKVYDGTDSVVADKGNLTTSVSGVSIIGVVATYDNANVGTGKTITVRLVLDGADKDLWDGRLTYNTGVITAKTLSADTATVAAITAPTYSGAAQTPTPTVTDTARNAALVKDTDYTISYTNNINAGTNTATITFTGKGNYTGNTLTATFTINKKNIATDGTVATVADVTYDGEEHAATPAVTNSAKNSDQSNETLVKDTDYTISYSNTNGGADNVTDAGTVTITVTGAGNYTGTMTKTFVINKATIDDDDITFVPKTDGYVGQAYSTVGFTDESGAQISLAGVEDGAKKDVEGTFAWKTPTAKIVNVATFPETATITATAVFTPANTSIAAYEKEISFTATQLKVTATEYSLTGETQTATIPVDYGTAFTKTLTFADATGGGKVQKTAFNYTQNGEAKSEVFFTGPKGYAAVVGTMYDGGLVGGTNAAEVASIEANHSVVVGYSAAEVSYNIYHVKQRLDGTYMGEAFITGGSASDEVEKQDPAPTAMTGTSVNPQTFTYKKDYTGFELDKNKTAKSVIIAGDGSTNVFVYYARKSYTVTFSATGASNIERARTLKYGANIAAPTKVPYMTSCTFLYWSAEKGGEEFDFDNSEVTGNMTLYAVFEAKNYKVIFDFNIGNGADQIPSDTRKTVTIPGAEILGGVVNWNTASLFNESFDFQEDAADSALYEITYSMNNLTSNKRISGVVPTAIGFTFDGWYETAEDGTLSSKATEVLRVPGDETPDEIYLTAKWARTKYTIRFDAQNDTKVTSPQVANFTAWEDILPATDPEKTGNKFKGWYATNDASDTENYMPVDQIGNFGFSIVDFVKKGLTDASKGYTVTVYGVWEAKPVAIDVADNSKGELILRKEGVKLDENSKVYVGDVITVEVKEKAGYKFKNLEFSLPNDKTSALRDGVLTFTVTTSLINTTTEGGEEVYFISLDAVYTERRFTITYVLDSGRSADGTFAKSFSPSELLETSATRAKLPSLITKNGYDFDGWVFVIDDEETHDLAHEMVAAGESYYGAELYLKDFKELMEYDNVTIKATWKAQKATVYLYNATYYDSINYTPDTTNNCYKIIEDESGVEIVTGSKIFIESPQRDSFMFMGWATTRNGAVVYPATNYDVNDQAAPIEFIVNADHDTSGNQLNRNNLYAVWHVMGVDYIVMTATNNNCTYGGDGITMSALPAQDYTGTHGANIKLTYRWYKVFSGMYDECFIVSDYEDKDGFKWYLDESGNITTYEKDGKYYTNKSMENEIPEPVGTKYTIKDFDPASVGTACELKFTRDNIAPGVAAEQTVVNVANTGTYICVVDVVAQDDTGSTTRADGYGEIEISMSKAAYGNIELKSKEVTYNTQSQWDKLQLSFVDESKKNGAVLPQDDAVDGYLKLPDGSKVIVTYTYYKGAGELIEGVEREQITDLSQIKNVGSYHVVVSFAWAVGGNVGNYLDLTSLEADLTIVPKQITSVTPEFTKDGEKYEGDAEFVGTYDGSAYGVEFVIGDKVSVDGTQTPVTERDDLSVAVKVYQVTENGDVEVTELPTTAAGTYAVVIQSLTGEDKDNYVLGGTVTMRREYTIGKKTHDIVEHIKFEDDDEPVYDGEAHKLEISLDDGWEMPDYIKVTYKAEYEAEDGEFTLEDGDKLTNVGVHAGIYMVTVSFEFTDPVAANNYAEIEDMKATLTINKADFLDYHNVDGKDLLKDGGYISASFGFKANTPHHPYVDGNLGYSEEEITIKYAYYKINDDLTRTAITKDESGAVKYYTHDELVAMDKAAGTKKLIGDAGKYEIVAQVTYNTAEFRNDYAEISDSKTTITYEIDDREIVSVSVVAWADDFDKKVKLGEAFNYEWIKQLDIEYAEDAGTVSLIGQEDIERAGIHFGKKGEEEQSNFWHVGQFELQVSYYEKLSDDTYTFEVYEEVTEVTIKYRAGSEGGYDKVVPQAGLPILTTYSFEISYTGTNEDGDKVPMTKYATILGAPQLGEENYLDVAEAGYYDFGHIGVTLYQVLTDVTWEYSVDDGENWEAITDGQIEYAGSVIRIRASKDDLHFEAYTADESAIYNVSSYDVKVGRSGNYLIEATYPVDVVPKTLHFEWNSNSFEYDMLSHVPTIEESGVAEADKEDVTFSYNYSDGSGEPILSTSSIVTVGTYKVTVSLNSSSAASNYTLEGSTNKEYTFQIVQAEVKFSEVYYSESNYGKNVSYKGNKELRSNGLKIDFGDKTTVAGTFKYLMEVEGEEVVVDGTAYETMLGTAGKYNVKYMYVPNNPNYKDLVGTIEITVDNPKEKTGDGALSVELGPNATDFYMLEDRIDTYDIHVYQLYESTYQENGKWYGGRKEITNNLRFSVKGYSGSLESYRVKAQDVSSGKIVLIARILGNTTGNSGEVEILAIDEAPTSMEIENAGKFRTKYYVGETPDFKDIEFKLNFKSSKNPVGGLKTPSIKTDFNGEVTYNAAENGKFKVTFSYAGTKVEYTFQALEKEDLTVIEPTNTILAYKNGEIIAVPELKFNVDLDPEDENTQKVEVGQNDLDGVTVKVSVLKDGVKTDLRAEGEYSIRYDFEITNPRFNSLEPIVINVKVTDNPYTLTITAPEAGKLNAAYSGSDIEIPKPNIGKIVDTRDENREVLPDSIIYKINGKELTREEAAEPWSRLHAGSYKVEVIVTVDGKTFNAEYTMVIAKTKNSDMAVTVGTVVLGESANFKFPVTAKFGADTVKYQYSQSREGGYTDAVPTTAGVWYVKATIAETGDYTGLEVIESFRVRENSTTAETGEGKVEGNIEGGDGIGADWKLSIKQIESETVSQVSISKQDALEGYKVELRNENNVLVKPEKAYTVNIKLSDALQGKKGLNVYYVDANGKATKLDASVNGEYVSVKMNNFEGSIIITTAQPKESVGLLVTTIVLGVVAAGAIAACVVVFILKRKKRS